MAVTHLRLLIVVLLLALPVTAQAAGRTALLIGNSDYTLPSMDLANPVNDITALESRLVDLGFDVRAIPDANSAAMTDALNWFERAATGAEIALFFYAGHGVQLGGENYLIGSDLAGYSQAFMQDASLSLSQIKARFDSADADLGVIILDACRNNPFTDSAWAGSGLAVANGGSGLLIAYATDPGNVAYDGLGDNSVFTQALLDNIAADGLDVRIMFGRVRQAVVRSTGGAQIPWVEESVLGEHYLGAAAQSVPVAIDDELALWREISTSTDVADFDGYLAAYPAGLFAGFARNRIAFLNDPRPYQPIVGDRATEVLLAAADVDVVAASLNRLGYLPKTRGLAVARPEVIAAFDAYRATLPEPQAASVGQLHKDAARLTVFLAAATGQRIRTDMAALASIERTRSVAEDAFAQLIDLAGDDDSVKPLIDDAAADIVAIIAAHDEVQLRLDASREYYDALIKSAQDNYQTEVTPGILSGDSASRSLPGVESRLRQDAALFVTHVQGGAARARGSYAWMTDFIRTQ